MRPRMKSAVENRRRRNRHAVCRDQKSALSKYGRAIASLICTGHVRRRRAGAASACTAALNRLCAAAGTSARVRRRTERLRTAARMPAQTCRSACTLIHCPWLSRRRRGLALHQGDAPVGQAAAVNRGRRSNRRGSALPCRSPSRWPPPDMRSCNRPQPLHFSSSIWMILPDHIASSFSVSNFILCIDFVP